MTEAAPARRHSIDLMRILSAFGIVWYHQGGPAPLVAATALPIFLMLLGALSVRSAAQRPGLAFCARRAVRLLGPWLPLCLLYLVADAARFGWREALTLEDPLSLLVGPSIHLWFLPFAAAASVLAVLAARHLASASRVRLAALALAPLAAASLILQDRLPLPAPLGQWVVAVGPFSYGLLFATGRAWGAPGAALAFGTGVAGLAGLAGSADLAAVLLAGALLFEALWRLPLRHPLLPVLGDLSAGIYFIHPLAALGWYAAGGPAGAPAAIAVFVLSGALTAAVRAGLRALPAALPARRPLPSLP